jgi:hypothetical protein
MVETAAHLRDHVFPRLPVRQWVLSVPKRLRYSMQRDAAVLGMVLRIFLRVIEQTLQASLNEHVHFHVCVVDGVFEEVAGDCDVQAAAPGVVFHPGGGIDGGAVLEVQATLRRRILRAFVGRGLLESFEAKEMLAYKHSGFSVDAGVRIEAHDRAGLGVCRT